MFVQTIRSRTSDPKAIRASLDRWQEELAPTVTGWLGDIGGVTEDGELFLLVRFDSEESARANSLRPEQGEWWAQLANALDGDATFRDCTKAYFDTNGDLAATGFVQIRLGQVSDGDRMLTLIEANSAWRTSRPDILGIVAAVSEDGQFTNAVCFTSYDAAHEGESQHIPADVLNRGDEMMSLIVGELEYLDLRTPWLDSPV